MQQVKKNSELDGYNQRLVYPRILDQKTVDELKAKFEETKHRGPIEIEDLILDREESIMLMKSIYSRIALAVASQDYSVAENIQSEIEDYLEKRENGTKTIR